MYVMTTNIYRYIISTKPKVLKKSRQIWWVYITVGRSISRLNLRCHPGRRDGAYRQSKSDVPAWERTLMDSRYLILLHRWILIRERAVWNLWCSGYYSCARFIAVICTSCAHPRVFERTRSEQLTFQTHCPSVCTFDTHWVYGIMVNTRESTI